MRSVADTDKAKLDDTDPTGYVRFALGPPRPAPRKEAAGSLPQANWPCPRKTWQSGTFRSSSEIDETVPIATLRRKSAQERLGDVLTGSEFLSIRTMGIVRCPTVARFRASRSENVVFPDERVAVVVLTNQDAPVLRERLPKYCAVAACQR